MNRIGLIAVIAALAAASALAQPQTFEPAVPKGLPESRVEPSGELRPPAPPQLVMNRARGNSDADARQCLQLTSNKQIHRCAERYRSHASRAGVTKAKIAKSADPIRAADRARSVDLAKPDMSKAADPAKTVAGRPVDMAKPATTPAAKSADAGKSAPAASPPAPPKWTDTAKGIVKSQGDRLNEK